jgi:hypothetical protein
VAVLRWCLLLGSAVLAVAILAAGLPSAPVARPRQWRVFMTIGAARTGLADVVATGAHDAWAAGMSASSTPVVYRWNGSSWRPIPRPGPPGSSAAGVAASSAANVWVTIVGDAAVDRWNGHAWSRFSFGPAARTEIDGVTTSGRKDVWVFAYNRATRKETAVHYNGTAWTPTPLTVTLGGGGTARLVSSSSRSNVWAWAYDVRHRRWVSLRFNGRAWRVIPLPATLLPARHTVVPEQMLAESAASVWGTVYAATTGSRGPVVLVHWNGRRWRRVTGRRPAGTLAGPVAADGHGGLWLCADRPGGAGYLLHYSAGTWTTAAVPARGGTAASVTGLTLIPGTRSLWGTAVMRAGSGGSLGAAILRYSR